MSGFTLTLKAAPALRLDLRGLTPTALAALGAERRERRPQREGEVLEEVLPIREGSRVARRDAFERPTVLHQQPREPLLPSLSRSALECHVDAHTGIVRPPRETLQGIVRPRGARGRHRWRSAATAPHASFAGAEP